MKYRESHTSAPLEHGVMAAVVVRNDAPWPAGRLILPQFDEHEEQVDPSLDLPNDYVVIPALLLN